MLFLHQVTAASAVNGFCPMAVRLQTLPQVVHPIAVERYCRQRDIWAPQVCIHLLAVAVYGRA